MQTLDPVMKVERKVVLEDCKKDKQRTRRGSGESLANVRSN
jgi:hypothetical protein